MKTQCLPKTRITRKENNRNVDENEIVSQRHINIRRTQKSDMQRPREGNTINTATNFLALITIGQIDVAVYVIVVFCLNHRQMAGHALLIFSLDNRNCRIE